MIEITRKKERVTVESRGKKNEEQLERAESSHSEWLLSPRLLAPVVG